MSLYTDIISPAIPILARMEARGIPLDVAMRDRLRSEAEARLEEIGEEMNSLVVPYHVRRAARVQALMDKHTQAREAIKDIHDTHRKTLTQMISKCRTRLKQIGETFQAGNDNAWRTLLFDKEVGLGLEAKQRTETGLPALDKDAIRELLVRYPAEPLLKFRVEVNDLLTRLRNRLSVEPDERGRVHFAYSLHRTTTGRLAAGKDDDETDKERLSEGGNAQNVADRDRRMFRAEPGYVLIQADWSQVEARVQAWLARDTKMLQAWKDGLDVHAMAAACLYHVKREEVRTRKVWFEGKEISVREAAKRYRHGRNYGMGTRKASQMYGIPLGEAQRLEREDDEMWPAMARFRKEEIERANQSRQLVNPFGRVLQFHKVHLVQGRWQISDREEALAFRPQSTVGDMCKAILPTLERESVGWKAELLATVHDSFLFMVRRYQVAGFVRAIKTHLEREWRELGEIEGFGWFTCPADMATGLNWSKKSLDNEYGLEEVAAC